jgi:hypothetical protein
VGHLRRGARGTRSRLVAAGSWTGLAHPALDWTGLAQDRREGMTVAQDLAAGCWRGTSLRRQPCGEVVSCSHCVARAVGAGCEDAAGNGTGRPGHAS